jgi:putative NIF3 family GTP cyclohydrolase 1 type 2
MMSKRDLKKYLNELNKEQLEAQIIELYDKFSNVKVYYDFVFNPNEEKLVREAKIKIANEYFPVKGKKSKMRRSVAQKFIKHYISIGVDVFIIADLMLYNIEIAQTFSSEKIFKQELFFKSMLTSFQQAVSFLIEQGILDEFQGRVVAIKNETIKQNWLNQYEFNAVVERFEY